jgi:hypothetical protein
VRFSKTTYSLDAERNLKAALPHLAVESDISGILVLEEITMGLWSLTGIEEKGTLGSGMALSAIFFSAVISWTRMRRLSHQLDLSLNLRLLPWE